MLLFKVFRDIFLDFQGFIFKVFQDFQAFVFENFMIFRDNSWFSGSISTVFVVNFFVACCRQKKLKLEIRSHGKESQSCLPQANFLEIEVGENLGKSHFQVFKYFILRFSRMRVHFRGFQGTLSGPIAVELNNNYKFSK